MSDGRPVQRRALLGLAAGSALVAPWALPVRAQDARLPGSFESWRRRFDEQAGLPGPEALRERGEALLAAGQADAALEVLQQAANLAHTPAIECTIVRAQVQAGAYRHAVAFAAHAALSHRAFPSAMALYAWLLHAGGQSRIASRLLDDALARAPQDAALHAAHAALRHPWPEPAGDLVAAPLRCAPYAHGAALDGGAPRCLGTAVLAAEGRQALAPLAVLATARPGPDMLVRNGLGRAERVRAVVTHPPWAVLVLDQALPVPAALSGAPRVHAGSPLAVVEHAAGDAADARWPLLQQGFATREPARGARPLGLALPPGPRGGPVFDRAGRLAGIALPSTDASGDTLVTTDQLPPVLAASPSDDAATVPLDAVYEASLRLTLQVLVPAAT